MRSLEERLAGSLRPGARRRGNVALDILTGRSPEHALHSRPLSVERSTRLASAGSTTFGYLNPPVAPVAAPARFRIVQPVPRRRSRVRRLLSRLGVIAALGFVSVVALRSWQAASPVTPAIAAPEPTAVRAAVPPTAAIDDLRVAPTEAPATPIQAPTVLAAPAAPLVAAAAPANQLRVLVDERFAFASGDWPGDRNATIWRANGTYRLRASQPTQFVAVALPGTDTVGDAIVTASFHKTGGPAGGGYGLIVRDQGPGPRDGHNQVGHFYVFEIGDQGQFGVWLRDADRWVDLLTWTPSDAIKPGTASNELTVTAIGDRISFLINGIPVASQVDTLHTGGVGIFTGGDGNEVAIEHLALRVPQ